MPIISSYGPAALFNYGFYSEPLGKSGWISKFLSNTSGTYITAVVADPNNSKIAVLFNKTMDGVYAYRPAHIAIIDSGGATLQKLVYQLTDTSNYGDIFGMTVDSQGNFITTGRKTYWNTGNSTFYYEGQVSKFSSAGVDVGGNVEGTGQGVNSTTPWRVATDSMDNIIVSGYTYTNNAWGNVIKYNDSLTTRRWGIRSNNKVYEYCKAAVNITDDSVYFNMKASDYEHRIVKTTSNGSITYQKYYGPQYAFSNLSAPVIDPSTGNAYHVGQYTNVSTNIGVFGISSDGSTTLIKKGFVGTYGLSNFGNIVRDSQNNYYFVCEYVATSGGNNQLAVFKINSSGTVQWARALGATTSLYLYSGDYVALALDNDNFVLGFRSTTDTTNYVVKLPTDGTGPTQFKFDGKTFTYGAATAFTEESFTVNLTTTSGIWENYSSTPNGGDISVSDATGISLTSRKGI